MGRRRCEGRLKFTKGDANRLFDRLFHPYFNRIGAIVLDSVAHFVIESDPKVSFRKFLRYNAKPLLKALQEELR